MIPSERGTPPSTSTTRVPKSSSMPKFPGMKKEDIDVHVENNVLTIRGKKERKEEVKEDGYFPDRAVLRNVQPVLQPAEHG